MKILLGEDSVTVSSGDSTIRLPIKAESYAMDRIGEEEIYVYFRYKEIIYLSRIFTPVEGGIAADVKRFTGIKKLFLGKPTLMMGNCTYVVFSYNEIVSVPFCGEPYYFENGVLLSSSFHTAVVIRGREPEYFPSLPKVKEVRKMGETLLVKTKKGEYLLPLLWKFKAIYE